MPLRGCGPFVVVISTLVLTMSYLNLYNRLMGHYSAFANDMSKSERKRLVKAILFLEQKL